MYFDPATPTGRAVIRLAANQIRIHADTAANNGPDNLCRWQFQMVRGHETVLQSRVSPDGDVSEVVIVPVEPGIAQHVALWHPNVVRLVATLLETISAEVHECPDAVVKLAEGIAQSIITDHRQGECDPDCPGWHHIAGAQPPNTAHQETRGSFYTDLERNMQRPEFKRAYEEQTKRLEEG